MTFHVSEVTDIIRNLRVDNNEQTNSLRNLLKEQSCSDSLYNELS